MDAKISKLHEYMFKSDAPFTSDTSYKGDSVASDSSVVKNLITKYEYSESEQSEVIENGKSMGSNVFCKICKDPSVESGYIILSCNHMFHILCLAETHFTDIYKYPSIDSDYFTSRKCNVCNVKLEVEELVFLHSKFLSTTNDHIKSHDHNISELEKQLGNIKTELRACYEYKHKLEQEREKSKQIVSILSTMTL
ncbi:MAG: hypothetical protein EBU90_02180 [Proteobacteria bacterium]|nr:hypothetical protein [Pseudomonadota bacterium]NBP13291.1 hypothetical protein [bacterium]